MHKLLSARVVTAVVIFIIAVLAVSAARADNSSPWLNTALGLQKQADTKAVPTAWNGNIDCAPEDNFTCSVPTAYGAATQNNAVRLNGTPDFRPVISYIDNRQHFLPVPNSSTVITYTTEPPYGFYLYFNYNFSSAIKAVNNSSAQQYQIVRPPDGKLADKTGHRLAADYASMSFSQNGQWMVVSQPNVAMLRVNLQTFEVVPFAPKFDYTIGLDPAVKTAISNDGRYAVVASKDFNSLAIYDLNTCPAAPDNISGPLSCQSRDLKSFMQQQVPGYGFTSYARFLDDDNLGVYATYNPGSGSATARFIISTQALGHQLDLLALGDSYISGEGAFDYVGGTDTSIDHCHLSNLSYPFLLGHDLNYNSYKSVACSGATTNDVTNTSPYYIGQADRDNKTTRADWDKTGQSAAALANFLPGYVDQLDFVGYYQPKAIVLSVFGNDVDMIGKLKSCIKITPGTCFSTYEDRLEFVREVERAFPKLVNTYTKLKAAGSPDSRIYVSGYPQIAKAGGDCAVNVQMDQSELQFTQQAIDYLDSVIKAASAKAGVFYVDAQDAFYGHRLCEAGPGSVAMNGLTAGNDIPKRLGGPIGSESYHPNPFGHQLLENKVLAATANLTAPMPAAEPSAGLPAEAGLPILNAPHSGRAVNATEYDPALTPELAYRQVPTGVSVDGAAHGLAPGATLQAELHSAPINLGSYKTDSSGNLAAKFTIPAGTPTGYHSLHLYGTDLTGQSIDVYDVIYVAGSADDLDGDGLADSTQKCVGVEPSGQDFDQDGVDDACDGTIGAPPQHTDNLVSAAAFQLPVSNKQSTPSSPIIFNDSTPPKLATGTSAANQTPTAVLADSDTVLPAKLPLSKDNNPKIASSHYLAGGLIGLFIALLAYAVKRRAY